MPSKTRNGSLQTRVFLSSLLDGNGVESLVIELQQLMDEAFGCGVSSVRPHGLEITTVKTLLTITWKIRRNWVNKSDGSYEKTHIWTQLVPVLVPGWYQRWF